MEVSPYLHLVLDDLLLATHCSNEVDFNLQFINKAIYGNIKHTIYGNIKHTIYGNIKHTIRMATLKGLSHAHSMKYGNIWLKQRKKWQPG